MGKNIVVCCDGTGNQFGEQNSNVIKLYKTLVCNGDQVAYYHPGVGTIGARNALSPIGKWWTRLIGLAFGYGISDNIADAYQFLMETFEPGDRVFVFGFSRGAYTARALCGMLHIVGLLTEGNEGLIPYAIRMIKRKKIDFGVAADFKKTFSRECKPYFVGVWDTVSSLGWVYDPVSFPFTRATKNPDFHIVRHAVSIDERRAFFRDNLFGEPHDDRQDVKEVWFAGVHSDVGGSYPEPESQLSKIALQWMLCEAELAGLKVDSDRKADILGAKPPYVAPDPLTKNQHESLKGLWWIAEFWPKIVNVKNDQGVWKKSIRINLGRGRWIPPDAVIAESVKQRLAKSTPPAYRPGNLPEEPRVTETGSTSESTPSGLRRVSLVVKERRHFVAVLAILLFVVAICIGLWHFERLQPWIASIGTAMVTILGTAPGLMNPEMQRKWLALVGVAALIGLGTLFASKYEETQRDDARNDAGFSKSLLAHIPPSVGDELCKGVAREIQQLVLRNRYGEVLQKTAILRTVQPSNGHVLAFEGYAYRALKDYGDMLTAFKNYEHYADKVQADALSGDADECYSRSSGYCAERTALVAHLLAAYSYSVAQTSPGAAKIQNLQEVVTHEKDMLKARKIGFRADSSMPDSVPLLRDTAAQLMALGQPPDEALAMAAAIEDERQRQRKQAERTSAVQ